MQAHYLEPRGISVSALAEAANISRKHVSNIVNCKVGITAETAVRFAEVLDTTPHLWLNIQNAFDIWESQAHLSEKPVKERAFAV